MKLFIRLVFSLLVGCLAFHVPGSYLYATPQVGGPGGGQSAADGSVDLGGIWNMKDFTRGLGTVHNVQLPGNMPKDCIPCSVPGTVRNALLEAGKIPDPYVGYNNEKSLWVEDKEWWFFKTFTAGAELKGKWIDIVFEGASFQGDVWLNGQRLGELKGMLNPRAFDGTKLLNIGRENYLAVRLEATPDARMNETARGLTWDSPRDQLYSIAQCMYGWDWGPHGVPVGLWKTVRLRVTGALRVDHPYINSHIASPSLAECTIELDVHNLTGLQAAGMLSGSILEKKSGRKVAEFHRQVDLQPLENKTVSVAVTIADPKLWWPNGMGEQNLYVLQASVSNGDAVSEQVHTQFGVRELKLVDNEQVEEYLKSMKDDVGSQYHLGKVVGSYPWTFQINGKKMFAKGGNWIPVDQLLRLDRDRYDRLLTLAREAGFNLLRVWGGGLYETEDFYELCDEYGILAWQEFLSNRSFARIDRENFLDGAASAVFRLRNHPSLTFWCGGNEFDPDDAGSKAVIDALEALLKKLDPQREFHRASPYQGDDHHWGVWHGQQPYTTYRVVRPFRSESGVNAFPVAEDYRKFVPDTFLWPLDTTFIEYHGEYNTRFQHLQKLSRYANEFGPSSSIEQMINKSELYQALANSFNMEYCRANMFRNSGLLIWQYNDIWPCVSWSMVDWYGTPKPTYYYQKRASRPMHIGVDFERYVWKAGEEFSADIHFLNDTEAPAEGYLYEAKLLDRTGKELARSSGSAQAPANSSATAGHVTYDIPASLAGSFFFVSAELKAKDGAIVSSVLYPIAIQKEGKPEQYADIFADIDRMPPASLNVNFAGGSLQSEQGGAAAGTLRVENAGSNLCFFVRLRLLEESDSLRTFYGDNYFSLLPGESANVAVKVSGKGRESLPGVLHFEVSGWNCRSRVFEVQVRSK